MAEKTICVWGKSGCGKTTLAVNLAGWLAQNHMLVGLISATDYGEIPSYFATTFPANKGLKAALDTPSEHIKNFYVEVLKDSSLYVLSPSPDGDSFEITGIDKASGRRILMESQETFDVVIVDCTTEKANSLTGEALAMSDAVIFPIDDNVSYPSWFKSNERVIEHLRAKSIFVESKYNGYTNIQALTRAMNVTPITSMQYIKSAPNMMNEGKFIFKGGREQKIYESGLNAIWEAVNGTK